MADDVAEPITRDQIAESIRSVRSDITEEAETRAKKLIPAAIAGPAVIVVLAYLIG